MLDVAGPLFWREGYRAVGVDRVIADAGVAKATFYKHFPAKDDLILAWLDRAEKMSAGFAPPEDGPQPLTDYALAMVRLARGHCLGCTWQGTAAEFHDLDHPAHAAALATKQRVLAALERRAGNEGLAEPRAAAERVFLLLEGVWATARMFGTGAPLEQAEEAIRRLVGARA
ncbi:MAG: TetR/AcrR family transcriptional regulator [Exiguobacterium profundum]|nr:MAG: TetR/AcrR family transcriptional regulator [Exiguobacterium profundum]